MAEMKQNNLKKRMAAGECVFGIFINSGSTIACEVAGLSGFDFVMIDSEHAPTDTLDNRDLIAAAEYRDTVPLVRVPNGSYDMILRTLDVGAHGVMIPQVNTPQKAKEVVEAALYTPLGNRGVATTRSGDYGFFQPLSEYFRQANERNLVIVQCENVKAIPNLEEICAVDGVDVVFVGPYDLSASMGQPGKVDYESIREVADNVLEKTARYGKYAGIFTKSVQEAKMYAQLGFRFIIVGTDISCMVSGCRGIADALYK
jgi:4-hydroxy-2-oxoheptanedioate aldolase